MAIATVLLALGSFAAHAKTMEFVCSFVFSEGGGSYGWRDLGNGFVAFRGSGGQMAGTIVEIATGKTVVEGGFSYFRYLSVENCATGETLNLPIYVCGSKDDPDCRGNEVSLDVEKQVDALLDEATSPSTRVTFEDLVQRFKALTPYARVLEASETESCACHVAYPRLRGDKRKFGD